MRLAHKRKVQMKLQKRIKAAVANLATESKTALPTAAKTVFCQSVAENKAAAPQVVAPSAPNTVNALTPKQKQVLEIISANADGINPKSIGLAAGQEEAKAASWATGALKKLLDDNLVKKEQLAGNKVRYKLV